MTVPLTDNSPMPFGKYIGKPMVTIPAIYLIWLYDNGCQNQGVKNYITANLDCLKKETSCLKK